MPASSNAMPRLPASTTVLPQAALNSRLDDEDALWSYLSDDSNHDDELLATVSPNLLAPNRDSLNPLSVTPDQLRSQLLDLAAYDLNSSSTSRTSSNPSANRLRADTDEADDTGGATTEDLPTSRLYESDATSAELPEPVIHTPARLRRGAGARGPQQNNNNNADELPPLQPVCATPQAVSVSAPSMRPPPRSEDEDGYTSTVEPLARPRRASAGSLPRLAELSPRRLRRTSAPTTIIEGLSTESLARHDARLLPRNPMAGALAAVNNPSPRTRRVSLGSWDVNGETTMPAYQTSTISSMLRS